MKKIYLILVFCLILILLMPVAFASDDNSTLDNSIENLNDKTTYENMKTVDEKFRDPIDDDFTDVNSTFYELKYNLLEPKSSTIQSDDLTKYYRNESKFHATFFNTNHTPLINTNITFEVNGRLYTKTTNNQGVASIGIDLRPGIYYITSTNPVDNSSNINKITVLSTIISEDIVKYYRNNTHYWATILDGQGNPMPNINVKFNINGVLYTRTTNNDGVGSLAINLRPGEYVLTAYNPVTGEQQGFNITVKSLIVTQDLTKYYMNASSFQATIYDKNGSLAVGKNVTFNINGVFYTRTADENGVVSLAINLRPGEYIITTMYEGLAVGNNIVVLPTLVTRDLNMTYGDGSNFTAQTLDGQGKPLANQNVTFNINGVFYNKITDDNGVASLTMRLMSGKYIITSYWNDFQTGNTIIIS